MDRASAIYLIKNSGSFKQFGRVLIKEVKLA